MKFLFHPLLFVAFFALACSEAQSQGVVMPSLTGAQWNGFAVVSTNPSRGRDGRPLYCEDPKATVERGKCHVVGWVGRDTGDALPMSEAEFMDRQIRRSVTIPPGSTYEIVGIGPNFVGSRPIYVSGESAVVYIRVTHPKK